MNKRKRNGKPEDRLPPHSVEHEQAIIGCLLLHSGVYDEVRQRLHEPGVFYDLRNQTIWSVVDELKQANKSVSVLSVREHLSKKGELENVGGYTYLTGLQEQAAPPTVIDESLDVLVEKWMLRKIVRFSTEAVTSCYDSGEAHEVLSSIQTQISDCIAYSTPRKAKLIREYTKQAMRELEEFFESDSNVPGIPTGFDDIDKMTSGFGPGEIVVLASRPSVGKTALAMNIAEHVAIRESMPVGIFSLEMNGASIAKRIISATSGIDLRRLRRDLDGEQHLPELTKAARKLFKAKILLDDTPYITIGQLCSKAKLLKAEHGIRLLIIDYLQLIRSDEKFEKRYLEVSMISKRLRSLANELLIPMIVLCQLGREADSRKPRMCDLQESSAIEQDADTVMLMYRKESANPENVIIHIPKQRSGPTGYIKLKFEPEITRFRSANKIDPKDVPDDNPQQALPLS